MCWLSKFFTGTIERPSPSDIVPASSVQIIENSIVVNLTNLNIPFTQPPKVWLPPLPDTNSMDPEMDNGHNNILIAGVDEADQKKLVDFLQVGDIAVYRSPRMYAIHRIVEKGEDEQGRYFRFKGDNNAVKDPDLVRDNEIQWLCIGTIF